MTSPLGVATLNDPDNLGGAADPAILANLQQAIDAWMPHLIGHGTVTVQMNITDIDGGNVLADCGPTVDLVQGSLDGKELLSPDTYFELRTGSHFGSYSQDITINLNSSFLSQLYTGLDGNVQPGQYDLQSILLHEMERGLGFGGQTRTDGSNSTSYETMWDHYLTPMNGSTFFTGANAEAVNGGPVQVCTLDDGEGYSCISNGGDAYAADMMSGLGLPTGTVRQTISSIDLAILADVGAPITGIAGTVTVGNTLALSAGAGTPVSLSALTLADTGALTSSIVTLTLSDTHGVLAARQSADAAKSTSTDGHTLTLTGSLTDVQTELASATYASSARGTDTVRIAVADSYGNSGSGSLGVTTTASSYNTPTVLSLAATGDTPGPLAAGHGVRFTLTTSGPVTVSATGTVSLALSDGGMAFYDAAASTPTSLVFAGKVAAGQFDANLGVEGLTLAGGASVTGVNGAAAALDVGATTPGAATGLFVDAIVPIAPFFTELDGSLLPGSIITGQDGSAANGPTGAPPTTLHMPILSGHAEPDSTVVVTDSFGGTSSVLGTTMTGDSGQWSLATPSLADGVHSLTGIAIDAIGNVSAAGPALSLAIDMVAPTLALDGAPSATGTATTTTASPTLSGTAEAGSTVTLHDGAALVGHAQAGANGSWSVVPGTPLGAGDNILTATATVTDAAGTVSARSASLDLILDIPAAPAPAPAAPTPGASVASVPAAPPPFTIDGGSTRAQTYTADAGSHFAVVSSGTASIVANASPSSSMTVFASAGTLDFANGGGSGLVVGTGSPVLDMTGGTSGSTLLAFTGTGETTYRGGTGADEIISGGGDMSLMGGTGGSLLVFGGAGTLNLTGGGESDMIIGGVGAETISAGVGAVFGGTGGSMLFASGAGTFLAGNVSGDRLGASTAGGDILAGGAGSETLAGAGAANGDLIFAGTGADLVSLGLGADTFAGGAGSDTIQAGAGNATLFLGSGGASLLGFTAGSTGGTDTISGFRVGTDHLGLSGYARPASVTAQAGSTIVGLSDGTRIVLLGVTADAMAALAG